MRFSCQIHLFWRFQDLPHLYGVNPPTLLLTNLNHMIVSTSLFCLLFLFPACSRLLYITYSAHSSLLILPLSCTMRQNHVLESFQSTHIPYHSKISPSFLYPLAPYAPWSDGTFLLETILVLPHYHKRFLFRDATMSLSRHSRKFLEKPYVDRTTWKGLVCN
jgi:hypothetical protein